MAESPTQPILVRDGTVVPTAVGVSDPSLTLVEFTDGIGFFLAESFQRDEAAGVDFLESVSLRKYSGDWWVASEHERVVLSWSLAGGGMERQTRELKITPSPWAPAVFFLSADKYEEHQSSLAERVPELVLKAAFDHAAKIADLGVGLTQLRARHREALGWLFASMPGSKLQPKKEIIRISLPPKPAARQTVRLSLPPRPSAAKETVRLELPPSPAVVRLAPAPSKTKPAAGKLTALKKWLTKMFRKGTQPRRAASVQEVQDALGKLSPEERAELERWLKKQKPPEDPPPTK